MEMNCRGRYINLRCSNDGSSNITITKATYGSYNRACASGTCCAPNPFRDCTEDTVEVHEEGYQYMQARCDGKASCSFEFNGYVMDTSCSGKVADYLQVFYECDSIGIQREKAAAFMVRVQSGPLLAVGQVLGLNDVITNVGSHYNNRTHSFACPYHGVYSFSVTIARHADSLSLAIYQSKKLLSYIEDDSDSASLATASVVTECFPGETVFIDTHEGGQLCQSDGISHLFSGFLLQKLM